MNKQVIEKAICVMGILKYLLIDVLGNKNNEKEFDVAFDVAIEMLEKQLTNGWIPVSEGLPVNEERVLICANRKFQDGSIIQIRTIAMYEDGTMHTEDSGFVWEDIDFEYCEETDDYIIPEGWWEQTMYCEEFSKVDDFVTHWQPLPEPYKELATDNNVVTR